MDTFDPRMRSEIMRRVKSTDTTPEIAVRKLVHRLGFRYRLHVADLPGKPDMVFKSRKKVIFVHGCFWHWHEGCPRARMPAKNRPYWERKIARTMARDKENIRQLLDLGWSVLVVWECETKDKKGLANKLQAFLQDNDA